jgi:hypothetical protein
MTSLISFSLFTYAVFLYIDLMVEVLNRHSGRDVSQIIVYLILVLSLLPSTKIRSMFLHSAISLQNLSWESDEAVSLNV